MPPSKKVTAFNPYIAEIQGRFQADFEKKARTVNSELSRFVNKKIDNMLQEMAGVGKVGANRVIGISGVPSQLVPYMKKPWGPLNKNYVASKGNDLFFSKTGDLIDSVFKRSTIKNIHTLFGGYSNVSFKQERITEITRRDIEKYKTQIKTGKINPNIAKQRITFSVFGRLAKRVIPETIFDGANFKLSNIPKSKGANVNNPIALKLGIYKGRKLPYYRPLIDPYAQYYAKRVIPKSVREFLKRLQSK